MQISGERLQDHWSSGCFCIGKKQFCVILPDKHQIVSCGEDKYLRVMDLESGTEMFVKDVKDAIL